MEIIWNGFKFCATVKMSMALRHQSGGICEIKFSAEAGQLLNSKKSRPSNLPIKLKKIKTQVCYL